MTTTLSIIGTAGRKIPDGCHLTKALFERMVAAVDAKISDLHPEGTSNLTLVSGGAAVVDHIAVVLYLTGRFAGLTLYMPAPFNFKTCRYVDNGNTKWTMNPGHVSNHWFDKFNTIMGRRNMAEDIKLAFEMGAHLDIGEGFHSRNAQVAASDEVIACTWGTDAPDDGGTLDTWKKIKAGRKKYHISLRSLFV